MRRALAVVSQGSKFHTQRGEHLSGTGDAPSFLILQLRQLSRKLAQVFFCPLAFGDIANGASNQHALNSAPMLTMMSLADKKSLAQLTGDLGLILESKSVVARKLIERDRLVSSEPFDVVRH